MKKTLITFLSILCFVVSSTSQTTFAAIQNIDPNTGNEPYEIASGDLDADGDIDIVMATYDYNGGTPLQDYIKWYKNDGFGNFALQTTVSSTIRWVDGLIIADIDGQFGLDIVATSVSQNKLVYFLSDGIGGFGIEVAVGGAIDGTGQVVAGDINNDGNLDLATVSYTNNKTVWFSGDGLGNFVSESDIENGTTDGPYYIDLADFDGDNDLDVLVGFVNTQTIEIYYNQYVESGTMTVSWIKDVVTVDSGNSFLFVVVFADVNNDGNMDVVKLDNSSGDVEWFNKIKNGTSTPNTISDATIIARPGAVMIADLDNDTFNDVIVTDSATIDDAIIWFKGANNASPNSVPSLVGDNNYQVFAVTANDFDNTGDNDIAFVGNQNDTINWYENEWNLLGLEDNSLNTIRIYPNPTTEKLYIKSTISDNFKVSVFDLLGKKVMDGSLNLNSPLDVSQLHKGLYFINFEDYNTTYKFVKK